MAITTTNILLAFGLCLLMACTTVSASVLYCRVGQDKCADWGYTGQINQNMVCCPTLSGQGFIMNMGLKAPDNCKCKAGTAEQYPSNGASVPTGSGILGVLATLLMVFSMLVH